MTFPYSPNPKYCLAGALCNPTPRSASFYVPLKHFQFDKNVFTKITEAKIIFRYQKKSKKGENLIIGEKMEIGKKLKSGGKFENQ